MQGLTTEQLGCLCERMAKILTIFDILDAIFYALNFSAKPGIINGSDYSKFLFVEMLHHY